jgi:hypothetical protein
VKRALLSLALLLSRESLPELERALLDAARAGDAARVRRLIGSGARLEARDERGLTPLMRAAASASAEAVRALIGAGAEVDAARPSGGTALHEATAAGRPAAARLLLEAGAAPDARDRALGTPLDVAERGGRDEIAALLRRFGARGSGRSVGDRACVLRWKGAGYCGRIEAIEGTRYRLRIDSVRGCEDGCAPDPDCSEGRVVGGPGPGAAREAEALWARTWCLTQTGVP